MSLKRRKNCRFLPTGEAVLAVARAQALAFVAAALSLDPVP